ncbi:MAG TPA: hypothetical protein VGX76_14865, partial [Pirellulales bacterium]|nr:hypothetical protein [Pirellulales bacterium]
QAAFVEQLFHHFVGQSVQAFGPSTLDDLRRAFAAQAFHVRKLVVEVMVASALTGRHTEGTVAVEAAAGAAGP